MVFINDKTLCLRIFYNEVSGVSLDANDIRISSYLFENIHHFSIRINRLMLLWEMVALFS